LKGICGNDGVAYTNHPALIGGFITLDELSRLPLIRGRYRVLAEAAESVGTPQIRNAGTLAGNVCQRPWCWYYRNGFPCFKNGGNRCFSVSGENQFHAIFGGDPSFIVNRWSPWRRGFASSAPRVNARFQQPFFSLPRVDAKRENVLGKNEILASLSFATSEAEFAQHLPQDSRPRSLNPCRGERRDRSRDGWRDLEERPCWAESHPSRLGWREWRRCWPASGSRRN